MEIINLEDVDEIIRYGFECPYCFDYLDTEIEPEKDEVFVCYGCAKEFIFKIMFR